MRIGVIFDVHVSDKSPSTRKDDYRQSVLNKLEFCIEQANLRKYSCVLITGDLFHRKIPSHNSHALVGNLLMIFKKCNCPIYIIPGNHDISGNLTNLYQQPLYVLEKAGACYLLDNDDPVVLTDNEDNSFKVSINGAPFSALRDKKDAAPLYQLNHFSKADCKIGMFHQMILPDGMKFFSDYINFEDLIDVNSDIIIDGHYHVGFNPSVQHIGNKYFVNGGSLSRGSSEQFNLEKTPIYVELYLTKGLDGGFNFQSEDIPVPCLPGDKVFDVVAIKRKKETQEMKEFIRNLSEFEVESLNSQSPEGVIRVLETMGMNKNLSGTAEKYLTAAYEKLGY